MKCRPGQRPAPARCVPSICDEFIAVCGDRAPHIGDLEHGLSERFEYDGAGTPRTHAVRCDVPHDNAEAYARTESETRLTLPRPRARKAVVAEFREVAARYRTGVFEFGILPFSGFDCSAFSFHRGADSAHPTWQS